MDAAHEVDLLRRAARPLAGVEDTHPVFRLVGDAHTVLIGEATHGSWEFYAARAALTRRLVEDAGFDAVAVEADWPDALRASRWAGGAVGDPDAERALAGFQRFPQWMWRNEAMLDFLHWLRAHNTAQPRASGQVGFFGLDLYSLRRSMAEVLRHLARTDPAAAERARARYACFDHFGDDPQHYGAALRYGLAEGCEQQVLQQLVELSAGALAPLGEAADASDDERFYARQNARVVHAAEAYYRTMFDRRVSSWNLRDDHMAETLAQLRNHLRAQGRAGRIVVWAHNSHVGDARFTAMGEEGEVTLGQRVREAAEAAGAPDDVFLLGLTTHQGTVTAATDWDGPAERKTVLPSRAGSVERLLHGLQMPLALVPLRGDAGLREALGAPRLSRAIGVIYRPDTELASHYLRVRLAHQYDAVLHIDRTRALQPLDASAAWAQPHEGESETYPTGM